MGWFSHILPSARQAGSKDRANGSAWGASARQGVSFAASLAFENISRNYGDRVILNDISLTLEPGEIVSLLGPSGSGKSTLLRIAAGLDGVDAGRVLINETEVCGPNAFVEPEKRGVGLMFQDFALFPHLTVLQNVGFGLRELAKQDRNEVALSALERVGLAAKHDAYPHMLSGGEQQRVALARALAPRPSIILMDEPFSGLDARLRDAVRAESLSIVRETRASAIVVTHDPEEAMRVSDRICLLNEGQVVQIGSPADLYERPANLFAARFFSEANLFHGFMEDGALQTVFGPISVKNLKNGNKVKGVLCVREDGFDFIRQPEEGYIGGTIKERSLLGSEELLTVALNGHSEPVSVRVPCHEVIAGHNQIYLRPKLRQRLVFESAS